MKIKTIKSLKTNVVIILTIAVIAVLPIPSAAAQNNPDEKPALVVSVTGMGENAKNLLGRLLEAELFKSGRYDVIARDAILQDEMKKLRDYENKGNVDDSQLIEWGRENNAAIMCLVNSNQFGKGGYYFTARLIDVRSRRLVGQGSAYISGGLTASAFNQAVSEMGKQIVAGTDVSMTQGKPDIVSGGSGSERSGSNQSFSVNGVEFEMVRVQGGSFTMGCTPEQGNDCNGNERPAYPVRLSDFSIGKYEVTQAQWQAVMGSNPSRQKGDNLPVSNVSWNDAQQFIESLNAITGRIYRLPTEAEWEYAARGGNRNRYKYSGSNNVEDVAWYRGSVGRKAPHMVGTKEANDLGIHDMSGNVSEWVNDWFGGYGRSSQVNPRGAASSRSRVLRGGNWDSRVKDVRVSHRGSDNPGKRKDTYGFRLAGN